MKIKTTLKKLKRGDVVSIDWIDALSTGIFGFPMDRAASITLRAICDYLKGATCIKRVILVLFDSNGFGLFKKFLKSINT